MPALRQLRQCDVPIVIAGARIPITSGQLPQPSPSRVFPMSSDLTPLYDDARVFVAPDAVCGRYSAEGR